jgi:hypothetical protein
MNNFIFHIHKLGSSLQDFIDNQDESMVIKVNHPMVVVDDKVKKWGDEYIIIQNPSVQFLKNPTGIKYIGKFDYDRKNKKYVKLFQEIDIPINRCIDYYVTTINICSKNKINKIYDLIKKSDESFSCILSCAYNFDGGKYNNEIIIVCQPGDKIKIDDEYYIFDRQTLTFVKD